MVNEWDKRKLSDKLSDHLMDRIDFMWDQYMNEFRRMDEEKRKEAAVQRKKNQEMEEYKREKSKIVVLLSLSQIYFHGIRNTICHPVV